MKNLIVLFCMLLSIHSNCQTKSFYDFKVTDIHGKTFDFSTLKGKKVLIVNTASECSLAPQLYKLQELYEEYGGENFEIIAFPGNDFGNREPNDNEQIEKIYKEKFGISFPVMAKSSVKGDEMNPVYKWLTSSAENGTLDAKVMWNFQKFMVDGNGQVVDVVWPIGKPEGKRITEWIQEDL